MRFVALAADFDGTLAHDGIVQPSTIAALERLRTSGRRLILITGREVPHLLETFPAASVFDLIVAENGGVIFDPSTGEEDVLGPAPPASFVELLQDRGVAPMSVGQVVVATWHPHETTVLHAIEECGLDHHVSFNKGAVMVLPPSVNKGSGLAAALRRLRLSRHNVVAVGDAENDHSLFGEAECAVAVANALPMIKSVVDYVTGGDHGAGVEELIDALIEDDLAFLTSSLTRHDLQLGMDSAGEPVHLPVAGVSALIAGPPGCGKSTAMTGIVERLEDAGYQYCLLDPEGDYERLPDTVMLSDSGETPLALEVLALLNQPVVDVAVNLLSMPLPDRPAFFGELFAGVAGLRQRSGRPHWLLVDEAHHFLPSWNAVGLPVDAGALRETLLVTVEPAHLHEVVLRRVDLLIAIAPRIRETIESFCDAIDRPVPEIPECDNPACEALVWDRRKEAPPVWTRLTLTETEHRRHRRKYAEGDLDEFRSFYFRDPRSQRGVRVSNLGQFLERLESVEDEIWTFHLRRGDFGRWFRDVIRDDDLAAEARRAEALLHSATTESRAMLRRAIQERYTAPA